MNSQRLKEVNSQLVRDNLQVIFRWEVPFRDLHEKLDAISDFVFLEADLSLRFVSHFNRPKLRTEDAKPCRNGLNGLAKVSHNHTFSLVMKTLPSFKTFDFMVSF